MRDANGAMAMCYVVVLMMLALTAHAVEATAPLPRLITQYGCQSCHALDIRRHAPSFQAIALRYQNRPKAKDILIQKLRRGAAGAWGSTPMPPQVMVPDDQRAILIDWVLAQRPSSSQTQEGRSKK